MRHISHLRPDRKQTPGYRPSPPLRVQLNSLPSIARLLDPRGSGSVTAVDIPTCVTYQTNPNHYQHSKSNLPRLTLVVLRFLRVPLMVRTAFLAFLLITFAGIPLPAQRALCRRVRVRMQRSANRRRTAPAARSIPPPPTPGSARFTASRHQVHTAPRPAVTPASHPAQVYRARNSAGHPVKLRRARYNTLSLQSALRSAGRGSRLHHRDRHRKNRTTQPLRQSTPLNQLPPSPAAAKIQFPTRPQRRSQQNPPGKKAPRPARQTRFRIPVPIPRSWHPPETRLQRHVTSRVPTASPSGEVAELTRPPLFFGRVSSYTLRGTHDSLVRQNERSEAENLERIENDADLQDRIARGLLVRVPESAALAVNPALPDDRRYCRPWTADFLTNISHVRTVPNSTRRSWSAPPFAPSSIRRA